MAEPPTPEQERARQALWMVGKQVRACMREAFAEHGLTVPQGISLQCVNERGACSAGTLADMLGVTPATMTGILDRLEELGYARRVRVAEDRRSVQVELTPKGKALFREFEGAVAEALAEGFGRLTTAEVRQLTGLLEKMRGPEAEAPQAKARR
ncbi:MAG: MarR family transcriptional regulator [Halobacteriales archaeon]|nr:MarR family transcriptional regulator [Halobacteriales archaeon]